jgi:hypothetical protein
MALLWLLLVPCAGYAYGRRAAAVAILGFVFYAATYLWIRKRVGAEPPAQAHTIEQPSDRRLP